MESKPSVWKIAWSDRLSMGIPEIDEDHKRFAGLVNDLNCAIEQKRDVGEVRTCLELIVGDAKKHFVHEIKLLKKWKYPDVDEHAIIHGQILRALAMIQEENAVYGMDAEWVDAGLAVKDLLISHLLEEDSKYAAYHRARLRAQRKTPRKAVTAAARATARPKAKSKARTSSRSAAKAK